MSEPKTGCEKMKHLKCRCYWENNVRKSEKENDMRKWILRVKIKQKNW